MITSILVTGEGSSDMGGSNNGQSISTGEFYNLGPMALLAVRLLQKIIPDWNEDNIDFQSPNNWMTCISGNELARQAKRVRKHRPSKKLKKGFVEHANRATTMAGYAKDNGHQLAFYFHDTDRCDFDDLHQSIMLGFNGIEGVHGIPMIPKPTSEAWLICGQKQDPYAHCTALETELSGNDSASDENAPKKILAQLLGQEATTEQQYELVNGIDVTRIDMPSYNQFKADLITAIEDVCGHGTARTL
ncbi:hypothetical protein IS513_12135 [Proteus mirabilis]|uniref:hypothetical protein n=1 Tax=Proteus mirabilis TaxID=584 RepID=UPI001ADC3633|nr:hypothetical protein [Proteus mirabilis]MBO8261838.1 hypothetical protein [Proteus mirabilis]MBO8265428.1 hypothetical protein [Proteus mirabilis]MBO8268305.1 hypothetical protein [Proteus mirabilis]MBO8273226.1 hypothetical protein [Proteus mirabilis]MBO8277323.1 hypothetical protein [Proteus mirabilis]